MNLLKTNRDAIELLRHIDNYPLFFDSFESAMLVDMFLYNPNTSTYDFQLDGIFFRQIGTLYDCNVYVPVNTINNKEVKQ